MSSIKVFKRWKDHPDKLKAEGEPTGWFETTELECVEHTEGNGYYKPGTVLDALESQAVVVTPFAEYMADEPVDSGQ